MIFTASSTNVLWYAFSGNESTAMKLDEAGNFIRQARNVIVIQGIAIGNAGGGLPRVTAHCPVLTIHPTFQAKKAPEKVKAKLVYRDSDELDIGLQKVQPLPFLGNHPHWRCSTAMSELHNGDIVNGSIVADEEIEKYRAQIENSVPAAKEAKDSTLVVA